MYPQGRAGIHTKVPQCNRIYHRSGPPTSHCLCGCGNHPNSWEPPCCLSQSLLGLSPLLCLVAPCLALILFTPLRESPQRQVLNCRVGNTYSTQHSRETASSTCHQNVQGTAQTPTHRRPGRRCAHSETAPSNQTDKSTGTLPDKGPRNVLKP